ncbi:unnamed protein product [Didymodactylos carnosus]|uniref:Uncharacterized protein n=1 Tax=Didymodactylos carnosus TaxID=1234261 RepID=A0A8S2FIL6_9BILA|nr:unnamed protein product [Didymodactylos carnosus]CAF4267519.1 unnamed protein product [Didymodactylos carnosus]
MIVVGLGFVHARWITTENDLPLYFPIERFLQNNQYHSRDDKMMSGVPDDQQDQSNPGDGRINYPMKYGSLKFKKSSITKGDPREFMG